jgi:hypothetical protein
MSLNQSHSSLYFPLVLRTGGTANRRFPFVQVR